MTGNIHCPYCKSLTLRMTGAELHPSRAELINKHYHVCRACDAWAVCTDGSWEPVGPLANAELRRARQDAYAALERICSEASLDHDWSKSKTRTLAYIWMADEMAIDQVDLQIGRFGLEQCNLLMLIEEHRTPDLAGISPERARVAAVSKFGRKINKPWSRSDTMRKRRPTS